MVLFIFERVEAKLKTTQPDKSPKVFILLLTLSLLIFISACGRGVAEQPTPLLPTNTTTLTPTPPTPTPTATLLISELISTFPYTHTSNIFRIDYPENWQIFEQPAGAIFLEPNKQAGYSLFFSDVGETYSQAELNLYLSAFISQNFDTEAKNFKVIERPQPNDEVVTQILASDPLLGEAINEIRVFQIDTIVFIMLVTLPETQWESSADAVQSLIGTFAPIDTEPVVTKNELSKEEPIWVIAGPTSNKFGFLSPSDWQLLHQGENDIIIGMPDTDIRFEASVMELNSRGSNEAIAETAAQTYIDQLSSTYEDLDSLPASPFPLGGADGVTVDFLYTNEENQQIAGSIITAVEDGYLYQVILISPAEFYTASLEWFNPMLQDFRILAALVPPPEEEQLE